MQPRIAPTLPFLFPRLDIHGTYKGAARYTQFIWACLSSTRGEGPGRRSWREADSGPCRLKTRICLPLPVFADKITMPLNHSLFFPPSLYSSSCLPVRANRRSSPPITAVCFSPVPSPPPPPLPPPPLPPPPPPPPPPGAKYLGVFWFFVESFGFFFFSTREHLFFSVVHFFLLSHPSAFLILRENGRSPSPRLFPFH